MLVELDEEHTKCGICFTNFSSDRNNNDQKIRQHLPVLSSSQRCDHWFCHSCILREQLRVAEENNGRIPKWLKCMHCRAKTSFNPAEPKYHRLLIDLLARAQAARVRSEEQEETTMTAGTKRKTPPKTAETASERSKSKMEEGTHKFDDDDDAKKTAAKQGNGRAMAAAGPTWKSLPISATAGLKSPPEKAGAFMTRLYEEDDAQDNMEAKFDEEHTKCGICVTEFSCDRDNKDPEIRKHLPVLSSSQRCDHWFCHGCILREQLRVAEENNGRIPKWIRCMHCREKTSFNPAEPKYHRLLIDLLVRAQKYAAVHLKNEELKQEKSVGEQLDSGRAKSIKREVDAADDDEDEDVQLGSGNNVVCKKNECDAVDDDEEEREVKRPKTLTQSPPLVKVKEEPVEWDDQYDPRPLLESAFTNETSQSAATADCTNNQIDGRMPIVYLGYLVPGCMNSFSGVADDEQKKKRRTERITAAPITITQVSETTKKVGEEGKFISDDEDGATKTAVKEGEWGTAAATSAKRRSPPKESAFAGLKAPPELSDAGVIREGGGRELTEPSAKTDSTRPQDQTALTCKQISTTLNHQLPSKKIVHLCKAPSCPKFRQGSCKGYCTECFRQRNIHLGITLLEHASRCTAATCNSSNCLKMKSYLRHAKTSTIDIKAKQKAAKVARQAIRRRENKRKELKRTPADVFCDKFLRHVIKRNTTRLELDPLPKDETLSGYLNYRGSKTVEFVGSLVKTIVLPCLWFDGNKTRQAWEKDENESTAKTNVNNSTGSHAKNLKALLNLNIDDKYRDPLVMAEYEENNNITFGEYQKRPYAFETMFETEDGDAIANSLVPGFVKCSTYGYDEDDFKEVPHGLSWDGKELCTSNLKYVKLADTEDKYVIIDVAKNKEDKQLTIDTTGLRERRVAFYRVGDFLTREEIDRIITTCERCKHAIPAFILTCVKYRHHQLIKKNELATKKPREIEQEDEIAEVAEDFVKALREAMCDCCDEFAIENFERLTWLTWSAFGDNLDTFFAVQGKGKRANRRMRVTRHVTNDEEKKRMWEDVRQLEYTIILSITQQGTDRDIFRMFRCISEGFTSLESYLKIFEQIPFEEFFEVLVEICRPRCGMYTTRALTILSIFVVSAILFDGKVPTESFDILSFWQINEKKANLIRNCINGVYDGVGCDTHVIQFLTACAILKGVEELKDDDFYQIGKNVQKDPGAYMNEIIGECGQSFKRREDESQRWGVWRGVLHKVSSKRDEFKRIIDKWLPGWDNEVE